MTFGLIISAATILSKLSSSTCRMTNRPVSSFRTNVEVDLPMPPTPLFLSREIEARISSISLDRGLDRGLDCGDDDGVMQEYGRGDDRGVLSRFEGGKSSDAGGRPPEGECSDGGEDDFEARITSCMGSVGGATAPSLE